MREAAKEDLSLATETVIRLILSQILTPSLYVFVKSNQIQLSVLSLPLNWVQHSGQTAENLFDRASSLFLIHTLNAEKWILVHFELGLS